MVKQYELLVIGDQDVEENQFVEQITSVVAEFGAEITKKSVWGLRTLAFPIKKKSQGRYILIEFDNKDPKMILEISAGLRVLESILRFSIVSVKK